MGEVINIKSPEEEQHGVVIYFDTPTGLEARFLVGARMDEVKFMDGGTWDPDKHKLIINPLKVAAIREV